ncbi:PKD domain-containing protein [Tenacibaculum sp. M341]|uniref:PKD domain-containing protein n=1 Tax=Tenacibaculum sp. M341 TaxID=2530339 RepID=UPI0010481CDA|nr:PKD domain-containing protein [Tenacibaculum sp. M341]TCI85695.1 PKD domain-containing protein [Tenacibaculum sp. M341]
MKNTIKNLRKVVVLSICIAISMLFTNCEDDFKFELPEANSIEDTELPEANFSYIPNASDFTQIEFKNLSFESTTYVWDFGTGDTSTEKDPVYTFTGGEGTYTVSLTASDANGASDVVTYEVEVVDVFVPITPEIVNGDFEDNTDGWKIAAFTGGTTNPFNSSSDGSWIKYDGSDNGAKTRGAKWTKSTSAGVYLSSSTRYAYQAITVSPNTEYVLEFEYAIKDDGTIADGGNRIVGEILDGHFTDGVDAVASSNAGPLVRHVGDTALGKTSFTTVEARFTSNASGEISIWIYGVTDVDAYLDNVKVTPF